MKLVTSAYTLSYDPLDQQIDFIGTFRPTSRQESDKAYEFLLQVNVAVQGTLRLNFRKLRYINAMGVKVVSKYVALARDEGRLALKVIASGVIAWSERVLPNLKEVWDKVEFTVFDKNFYGSQNLIEDLEFIPLLRNQTRILWPLEKQILQKHGLHKGMKIADICCGCGDVPLLISRELHPSFITGVDHSEASIEYARNLQTEFSVRNAEFRRGDATALMLPDNSFDFVLCRLSLQIFSRPELILKELIRITKPGGRVYTVCEDYDLIIGHPNDESIRTTYDKASVYGAELGMDLRSGKKLHSMLTLAHLEDIMVDPIVVDTVNTDREAFAKVIESWRDFSVFTIGNSLKLSEKEQKNLEAGYDAHLRTIRSPYGYTTWTMIACSGKKPDHRVGT